MTTTTTTSRELRVAGAYVFTPPTFSDERGVFVSPLEESRLLAATGRPLFPVAQLSYSLSRRGVVRGVHYTRTPPGTAKYVYCPHGRVLDVIVDLRLGSPTFGRWDSVVLDRDEARAVYLPVGVGHLFVSLLDDTIMSYTLSAQYVPSNELAISAFDADLGLPIPDDIDPLLSARDSAAPTLAEARAAGALPDYARCLEIERGLHSGG